MPTVLSGGSVRFVTITSVERLANLTWGDQTWPIIWKRPILGAGSLWDVTRVGSAEKNQYTIRVNRGDTYLVPGKVDGQSVLSKEAALWTIVPVPSSGDVNLFKINNADTGGSLKTGFRYADPADAYAAVTTAKDEGNHSTTLWIIEEPRN